MHWLCFSDLCLYIQHRPSFPCTLVADVLECISWMQLIFCRHSASILSPTFSLHDVHCCFLIAGVQLPCSLPPSSCRWTCSLPLFAASPPAVQHNLPPHMGSLTRLIYRDLLLPAPCCDFFCCVITFTFLHPSFSILRLQWAALGVFTPLLFYTQMVIKPSGGWRTSFLFAASEPWACVKPRDHTSSSTINFQPSDILLLQALHGSNSC